MYFSTVAPCNMSLDLINQIGSIHLVAEVSFQAKSFGKLPNFWLEILAWKKLAKTFGM